jgi:HlyD family secretion protein
MVAVTNPDERLRPGMTAEVTLEGSRRDHAVRIPNSALAFRPPLDVLQAIGEAPPVPTLAAMPASDVSGASRDVWQYDGRQFLPIAVRVGLSDDGWTELLSGEVRPGDALVTGAVLQHRPPL